MQKSTVNGARWQMAIPPTNVEGSGIMVEDKYLAKTSRLGSTSAYRARLPPFPFLIHFPPTIPLLFNFYSLIVT